MVKSLRRTGRETAARAVLKIGQAALEECLVGKHAEGGGATGLVGAGDAGGIEIVGEEALAGGRFLDLRDDGGGDGEGGTEIAAGGEAQFGLPLPGFEGLDGVREILALFGDNTGQDVWNSVDQGC